ncbi:hypothetical protein GY45DRAFT_1374553 [Cubamyces sp. BRFM 1775]|nr:hypothetical protein GY45DRAFT_1374553 [Cubamyces sp. BRFM 1775]
MASSACAESVNRVLRELVCDKTLTVTFEDLLNRILTQHRTALASVPSAECEVALRALESELEESPWTITASFHSARLGKPSRSLRLSWPSAPSMTADFPISVSYNQEPDRLQASGAPPFSLTQTKEQARAKYINMASIVSHIQQALSGLSPPASLRDARRLPELMGDTFDTISYFEETNRDLMERIDQAGDRIAYLQGN